MKRSIALAAVLILGVLPVSASAVAYLAPNAAAHSGPARVTSALTADALGARVLPSPAEKASAPARLAICGMTVNNTWPSPTAVKLQCYFNDSPNPLHRAAPQIDQVFGLRP
jgi:hypothetical protein